MTARSLFLWQVTCASLAALLAVQSGKFFFGLGNVELDTFFDVFGLGAYSVSLHSSPLGHSK